MQCKKCGRDAPDESVFCPHCGQRLSGGDDGPDDDNADQAGGARRLKAAARQSGGKHPPEEELWNGTYSPKAMLDSLLAAATLSVLALIGVAVLWNNGTGWSVLGMGLIVLWSALLLTLLYRRLSVRY